MSSPHPLSRLASSAVYVLVKGRGRTLRVLRRRLLVATEYMQDSKITARIALMEK